MAIIRTHRIEMNNSDFSTVPTIEVTHCQE